MADATVHRVRRLRDIVTDEMVRHIDEAHTDLHELGDLPFDVVEPVLKCCTASQLRRLEELNPWLEEWTWDLWQARLAAKFPGAERSRPHDVHPRDHYAHLVAAQRQQKQAMVGRMLQLQTAHEAAVEKRSATELSDPKAGAKAANSAQRRSASIGATNAAEPQSSLAKVLRNELPPARPPTIKATRVRPLDPEKARKVALAAAGPRPPAVLPAAALAKPPRSASRGRSFPAAASGRSAPATRRPPVAAAPAAPARPPPDPTLAKLFGWKT